MTKLDGEGAEKTAPPLISQDNPGKPDALTLSSATEQNGNWKTAESAGNPAERRTENAAIRLLQGQLAETISDRDNAIERRARHLSAVGSADASIVRHNRQIDELREAIATLGGGL